MKQFINILFILASLTIFASAQTKKTEADCPHKTSYELFNLVRVLPVEITAIEDNQVFWAFKSDKEIVFGSFVLTEKTRLPDNFRGTYTQGKWFVFYCEQHKII